MIIPPIGSQLPNNFSRPTYVHSFAESFPSGGAFLLVLQIFAPKSKCGGGGGGGGVKALPRSLRALVARVPSSAAASDCDCGLRHLTRLIHVNLSLLDD